MKALKRIGAVVFILIIVTAFTSVNAAEKKKVLFIDSYHEGYAWSDGITKGVSQTLGSTVELKVFRMDTKRNNSEEFKVKAGEDAKALIEGWKPDVVIAADDNASKYIIQPFFSGKDIPFVFCGLNWDSSIYGFSKKNVCGMEEVALIEPLLDQMKKFGKGDKFGVIAPDNETVRKEKENIEKKFNLTMTAIYAKTYDEWKEGYKKLQETNDFIIIESDGGLYQDKADDMKKFVLENTSKPTGSCYDFMAPYALITYSKIAEEQGEWAAAAALRILEGESPEKIGITQNKKGKLYVNLPLATKLGIKIPLTMLKSAEVIKN